MCCALLAGGLAAARAILTTGSWSCPWRKDLKRLGVGAAEDSLVGEDIPILVLDVFHEPHGATQARVL